MELRNLIAILLLLIIPSCVTRIMPIDFYLKTAAGSMIRQCNYSNKYTVYSDLPDHIKIAIKNGFNYFNRVLGYDRFVYAGESTLTYDSIDDNKIITVCPSGNDKKGAIAIFLYGGNSGCMIKNGIQLRPDIVKLNRAIVESFIRHEIGHVLGMKHSPIYSDLMYFSINITVQSDHPKSLSDDEKEALITIYR